MLDFAKAPKVHIQRLDVIASLCRPENLLISLGNLVFPFGLVLPTAPPHCFWHRTWRLIPLHAVPFFAAQVVS